MKTNYIPWRCPKCGNAQYTEMHQPGACFVSMNCDDCDFEEEGCRCDGGKNIITNDQMAARTIGKRGGQSGTGKSKVRGDADYYSNLAKKRKPAKL